MPKTKILRKIGAISRFPKISPIWRIFEFLDQNRDFRKILTKIEIFRCFDQNQDFPKFWTKSIFFRNFYQNGDLKKKKWPKSRFSEILTKIVTGLGWNAWGFRLHKEAVKVSIKVNESGGTRLLQPSHGTLAIYFRAQISAMKPNIIVSMWCLCQYGYIKMPDFCIHFQCTTPYYVTKNMFMSIHEKYIHMPIHNS